MGSPEMRQKLSKLECLKVTSSHLNGTKNSEDNCKPIIEESPTQTDHNLYVLAQLDQLAEATYFNQNYIVTRIMETKLL